MKTLKILFLIIVTSTYCYSQSLTPTIKYYPDSISLEAEGAIPSWILPFRGKGENDKWNLRNAYDESGSYLQSLDVVSYQLSIDTSASNSIYVELASFIYNDVVRIGFGTNISNTSASDSAISQKELAFQNLTSSGGTVSLNFSRPLLYKTFGKSKKPFVFVNAELIPYADIVANQDNYNPGAGMNSNVSFDLRLVNEGTKDGSYGNIFRFGFNGSYHYNLMNTKYQEENDIDKNFKNLGVLSFGGYLGIAMFNIRASYNVYNKNDPFFDDKTWLVRIDFTPVKF